MNPCSISKLKLPPVHNSSLDGGEIGTEHISLSASNNELKHWIPKIS